MSEPIAAEEEEPTTALVVAQSTDVAKPRARRRKDIDDIKIKRTRPKELRRHDISDEELEMLIQDNRDGLSEAFWALIGAAIAATPPSLESIVKAYRWWGTPEPLGLLHLLEILVVFCCFSGAWVIRKVSRGRAERVLDLAAQIRARKSSDEEEGC